MFLIVLSTLAHLIEIVSIDQFLLAANQLRNNEKKKQIEDRAMYLLN